MEITIRAEDTLSYYSHLFKVPLNLMEDSNPNISPTNMKVRGKVRIPGYISVPYVIEDGDSLWDLASAKGLHVDAILILNPTLESQLLKKDELIYIPERIGTAHTSVKTPCHYKSLVKTIQSLKKLYPFITVNTIGKSILGNSIHEIRIGRGKKKVHMNASFHANEWITTMVLMSLVNKYLHSLTNEELIRGEKASRFYEEIELSIVPMVNPDGVDLVLNGPPLKVKEEVVTINEGSEEFVHWKANIKGIDLNNQFPANWDICKRNKEPKSPASRDFPGDSPLTEPEAIAMADLAKNNSFDLVIAFHTQGEEFYWGYEGLEPPISEEIAIEFERVSGYQAIRYVNSHAGYKDWFIQEFKRPGFTIELGKGINPLPLSQFQKILKPAEEIFFAALSF
ncbi:g-D-glutamyl-meso-diaminopimelate peptidase [Bacillus sp. SORGH_AS 510]|uniref:M14 family metallopeptidase n=1 Tax=Bacillus sp. SORGH_AS_0510 TaxID=3041771 RepID=UPI00278714CA|nr:M14 family metallopeptidase [Bacillus sp. SORGH_AS_0510]MDQ1145054.1 g-D-glutamyl-meso-diaminopimelate peptidase [Bacillus sp. SORGH_AS_0510]